MKKRFFAIFPLCMLCLTLLCVSAHAEELPAWYPVDPAQFSFYHDEAAARVVDSADLFTDDEEQGMETRIAELRQELDRDIVIYTDVTDYGLGKDVCAADFYDFNGYGCGDEREGICLFIDMDPYGRGWWTCCTGSVTMGLYTEVVANAVDDVLYEYLAAGDFAAGVADWIENIATMYRKGMPFAPDWYPAPGEELTRHHDETAPRVVDELGVLSEAAVAALTAQAAQISQKYHIDAAIYVTTGSDLLSDFAVANAYYAYMGYGLGDDYDGILLTVFKQAGYYAYPRITAYGAGADKLSDVNYERLWTACRDKLEENEYYAALSAWLDQVEHMERTGRVQRPVGYWAAICLIGLLAGSAFGGISLGLARHKMKKPAEQRDADAYIDSSSRIADAGRYFLYTTTSQRYDPPHESSSRSSGGRKSHFSSYSGSSGSRHSGSGRSF